MFYCFLADGFEELEAIGAVDMLIRAGIDVRLVGVTGKTVTGAHNIRIVADCLCNEVILDDNLVGIMLPGGMPGTLNLEKSEDVQKIIDFAVKENKIVSAICAAPMILGHKGLLKSREAIAYPGFEAELNCSVISDKHVVRDGNFITAKGAGVAVDFGLEIVSAIKDKALADEIRCAIQLK